MADIAALAALPRVLRHRIVVNFNAEASGEAADERSLFAHPVHPGPQAEREVMTAAKK
jgi:hypothetical protein